MSCQSADEFFQEKFEAELKRTPDLLSTPDIGIDWNVIRNNLPLRKGVVLNLIVLEIRTYILDCRKFASAEISDPFIWQDSWKKPEALDISGTYLWWRGSKCPEQKTDELFFIYPKCCDVFPTASLSCAFDIGAIESREEIVQNCKKQYPSIPVK